MILDAILQAFAVIMRTSVDGLMEMIPSPPDWYWDALDIFHAVLALVYEFDTYVPVTFSITVASAVISTYLFTIAAELVRMVLSFITLGGGAK